MAPTYQAAVRRLKQHAQKTPGINKRTMSGKEKHTMKTWLQKLENTFRRMMEGRYGSDQMGFALLAASLVLSLFPYTGLLGMAGLGWSVFRMMSRNIARRQAENRLFLEKTEPVRIRTGQWIVRMRNRKEYKYHRCTKCHTLIRLKRGQGERHLKCPRCGKEYTCRT